MSLAVARELAVRDLGRRPYRSAWALQKQLVEERLAGTGPDTLLLVEHEPVITVGRGAKGGFLASGVLRAPAQPGDAPDAVFVTLPRGARAEVLEVERGGQATYHGPGQLVAYPIVKLAPARRDLHAWMRALEQAVIDALGELGLRAGRREGATGVWIDGRRKLCSIGVAASRWVTYHGLALNIDPDLAHFAAINPCGFDAGVMTSVVREASGAAAPEAACEPLRGPPDEPRPGPPPGEAPAGTPPGQAQAPLDAPRRAGLQDALQRRLQQQLGVFREGQPS